MDVPLGVLSEMDRPKVELSGKYNYQRETDEVFVQMVKAIESSGTQSNLESVTAGIIKKGRRRKPVLRKKLVGEIPCRQLLLVVGEFNRDQVAGNYDPL